MTVSKDSAGSVAAVTPTPTGPPKPRSLFERIKPQQVDPPSTTTTTSAANDAAAPSPVNAIPSVNSLSLKEDSSSLNSGSNEATTNKFDWADDANDTITTAVQAPEKKDLETKKEDDVQVKVKLADIQADPNSPLYSVQSFEQLNLSENLLKGIYALKYQKPSKIQERALPLLLKDPPVNMIGQSQSGTGKTAAFVLTMLSRVDSSVNAPQALCLAPSRELASQIVEVVKQMGKYSGVGVTFAAPGQIAAKQPVETPIVVGTPGTVIDLIRRRQLNLGQLKVFVLDEADNMLALQGLAEHSLRVKTSVPPKCQIVLFSATYPEEVERFAQTFAPHANELRLKQEELSIDGIKQFYVRAASEDQKFQLLVSLYGMMTIGQSMIFCARRATANRIAELMQQEGHSVARLHGALDPAERDKVLDDFREGRAKVLMCTNVVARGIDVSQVNMVINYDLPLNQYKEPDFETYLHRIGRTGRFGRTGVSINFIEDDQAYKDMLAIQNYFKKEMIELPAEDDEEFERIITKSLRG